MGQAGMIIAELALLASLCLLTARQARAQRRDFAAELAATQAGEYPPQVAYRQYRRAVSRRVSRAALWYVTILLFAYFITIFATMPDFLPIIGVPSPLVPIFFALLGLIVIAPPFLLSALTVSTDAAALVQLNGVATSARTLLIFRLKRNGLLLLPPALTVVECVTLYLLRTPPFRLLAVNFYSFVGEYAILVLAISPISRWLYRTEPIERTQWAEVGARALT